MNLANRITIFRILLIPFFVATLVYYTPEKDYLRIAAIVIFAIAILSDALDGLVARHFNQWTTLGTILDPVADKLLLSTAIISLTVLESLPIGLRLPPRFLIVVLSRDIIIILGSVIIHFVNGKLKVAPSRLGKITTFSQMATVIVFLLYMPYSNYIMNIAFGATILSGLGYIRQGMRLLTTIQ